MGIQFITLRRRSKKLLDEVARTPTSAWRRIELESVSRAYKTPRVLDRRITLTDYDGPLRQLTIADLGHEDPTLLLTNQLSRSASHLIGRYAQRMLIENNIEDGVDFFHMDASELGGGDEGQLRPATDADGQQPVPTCWPFASATATSQPSPATCSATSSTPRRGSRSAKVKCRGEIPEARPQPTAGRRRVRQDGRRGPLAGGKAAAVGLRGVGSGADGRAWCKVKN